MRKKGFTCSVIKLRFVLLLLFALSTAASGLKAQASLDSLGNFWGIVPGQSNKEIRLVTVDSSGFIYLSVWGEGLLRSTNNGTDWVDITNDLTFKNISAIEFDSTGKIYIGTLGGGVFYSTNNGNNWLEVNNGLTNKRITTLKIEKGGPMYVGTIGSGVFRSSNGGQSWTQLVTSLNFWEISAMIINKQGQVVIGTPRDGVYRSTDKGNNWMRSNGSITNRNITSFAMNSIGELIVGTLGGGVCLSVDGGGNWVEVDNSPYCKNVSSVAFATISSPFAGLIDNGIVRFDDQIYEEWALTNLRSPGVSSVARGGNNTLWAALPMFGLYKSTNRGQNWYNVTLTQNSMYLNVLGGRNNYVISSNLSGGVKLSSDNGLSWYSGGLTDYNVTAFGLDSLGRFLVGAVNKTGNAYGTLFRTTDNGMNWVQLWTKRDSIIKVIATNPQGYVITGLSFPPQDPRNPDAVISELYMTTNNGNTWEHIAARSQSSMGFPFISINYNGDIYINTQYGLNKSTNNGLDWTMVLSNTIANVTSVGFTTNRHVFCGTDLGLFKSIDNGFMWQTDDFGIPYPNVNTLIVTPWNQVLVGLGYTYGFLWSDDAGATFRRMNFGSIHSTVKYISQARNGFIFAASSAIYRSVSPQALTPPVLVTPVADAEGVLGKPTFTWNAAPNADMYEFQISTDPDFTNIKEKVTIGATSYTLKYNLESYSLHYWRVRSRVNASLSDWSPLRVLTTTITPPNLISPENNSGSNSVVNLPFRWNKVNGAGLYDIEVAKDSGFTNIVFSKQINDTTVIVPTLELYTKYFWHVRGRTFKAVGPWSDTWAFHTKLKPPQLKSPPHKSVGMPTIVILEWYVSDGGTKYEVRLAKDSLFQKMVFEGLAENNTQQQTKILENNTTYWWSIRSLNDDGNSDWSVPWKFTTVITAPTLVSPADNSIDLKTIQDFVWNADTAATTYHLQVSKDAAFTDLVFNDSTLTSVTFDNAMLDYYQRYYWRVRKYVGDVPGLWSEVWKLTTGIGKVVLISPADNSKDLGNDIVFIWENLKGADEYQFQLSEQSDFAVLVSNVTTADTRHEIISLDYDKSYYFRVKGKYADGEGEWSDAFTFRTKVYSGVDEKPVAGLTGFDIYPNPFSSTLNIGLVLNKDADIRLQITGLNGETIGEIYTGSLASGTYNFSYNPANLTQGSYLITLYVNGKSVTRQVVMIK